MNYQIKLPFALASIFIWIGFVSAISFMEAWLKFKAPGITLPLGLGIGKLIFNALNKVEWILAIIVFMNIIFTKDDLFSVKNFAFFVPCIIIIIQTFWLLPELSSRADLYISGQPVPESNIHLTYIILEFVKVIFLFLYGFSLMRIR